MSSKNEIPIRITTDADTAGAKEAQAAIAGIGTAAQTASQGFSGMLDGVPERIDEVQKSTGELEEGFQKLRVKIREVADESEAANEQAGALDESVKQITRIQKAQALSMLASEVGRIAGRFREAANEVEEFDESAAASMRQTADRIEGVTGAVSTLAMAFAVGGPIGAGVAALGLGINALIDAYQEAEIAAIKSGAAQKQALEEAADAARKASLEAHARAVALQSEEIEAAIGRQNDLLERGLQTLRAQVATARQRRREEEETLQAQDKLELAFIDEDEARGDITPAEAAKRRDAIAVAAQKRADEERKQQAREAAEAARKAANLEVSAFSGAEENRNTERDSLSEVDSSIAKAKADAEIIKKNVAAVKDAFDEMTRLNAPIIGENNGDPAINHRYGFESERQAARDRFEMARKAMNDGPGGAARLREIEDELARKETERQTIAKRLADAEAALQARGKSAKTALDTAGQAEADAAATINTVDTVARRREMERVTRGRTSNFLQDQAARTKAEEEEINRQLLEAQASGDFGKADELAKEMELRKRAAAIQREKRLSERQARDLARDEIDLEGRASKSVRKRAEENREASGRAAKTAQEDIPDQVGKVMSGARRTPATESVMAATEALRNGASANELEGLGSALEGLGSALQGLVATITAANAGKRNEVLALKKQVADLAEQIRRNQPK